MQLIRVTYCNTNSGVYENQTVSKKIEINTPFTKLFKKMPSRFGLILLNTKNHTVCCITVSCTPRTVYQYKRVILPSVLENRPKPYLRGIAYILEVEIHGRFRLDYALHLEILQNLEVFSNYHQIFTEKLPNV